MERYLASRLLPFMLTALEHLSAENKSTAVNYHSKSTLNLHVISRHSFLYKLLIQDIQILNKTYKASRSKVK